ncbi:hypothetical protein RBH29_06250 [Herbivorax sp. ANBcel31]|uniref:hypothetical protein n=1 Tax=Herbivorax sp. ANBcel31 TaxID=3069754 RepID=UPI0027AFD801|nr:hypothetical protein [Herbivorax sp. ANBcel31]MDQ2086040.1 hypothetical protein [Herbivorax sp. ANBcel31]
MDYMKYKLTKESIRFIELCQKHVLKEEITIESYNMMTDVKIDFLKNIMEVERTNNFMRNRFFNRVNNILKINSLIHSCYWSKKVNV